MTESTLEKKHKWLISQFLAAPCTATLPLLLVTYTQYLACYTTSNLAAALSAAVGPPWQWTGLIMFKAAISQG